MRQYVKCPLPSPVGGPAQTESLQVRFSYTGSEGLSEGMARGRLNLYIESKTSNGNVTGAERVKTMKLG